MRIVLIIAFGSAFVLSLILTVVLRRLALRFGFVDVPGGRKLHEKPTPQGGGVAIVLATAIVTVGAAVLASVVQNRPGLLPVPEGIGSDIERAAGTLPLLLYVLGGGLAIALFGLWDDIRPFRPTTKLVIQFVIAAAIVLASGMRISIFVPVAWVQILVTVVWIVVLTNSFNLLDNMDGLSGTVAFVCGGALLVVALQTEQYFIAGLMLALMGGVLGFLFLNLPPASVFMGDTGSMFIGYMLAAATILTTFVTAEHTNPLFPALVPLILFALPLYDTVSVMLIRLRHGKPLLAGDRNHLSHRLHRLGMGPRRVLVTIALVTLATSLGATAPYGSSSWRVLVPAVQAVALIGVIVELELVSSQVRFPEENEDAGRPS